jgi:hypothetical protein
LVRRGFAVDAAALSITRLEGSRWRGGRLWSWKWDPRAWDPATLARVRSIYDATSYDLRALKARGAKIVMWHGLADGGIMATSSIGYYEGVTKMMGGRQQTEDFFRLFLIPGVHHCGGGPGLTDFDALTLLENWVEKGQAPDVLIARR